MVFEEKADNYAIYSKYRSVYALLISFLKQFKKFFFHLIEKALGSVLGQKIHITTRDTVNIEVYMLS